MVKIYRRCPSCGVVLAASEFVLAMSKRNFGSPRRICCPRCTHTALASTFVLVEKPAEQEGQG